MDDGFRVMCLSSLRLAPPTPILFPYTTLFRSLYVPLLQAAESEPQESEPPPPAQPKPPQTPAELRDRKSTRLNSSHLGISYAVFCLKKKIKNATGDQHNPQTAVAH